MLRSVMSYGGMVTAPHHLAAQAGQRVLSEGGNAIEAMIASAATIAAVYPHMNALGGDNFWLIAKPGHAPQGIDACGGAAGLATIDYYQAQGHKVIPSRGPLAALTAAGAVSGWQKAFELSQQKFDGKLPLARLLEDAIHHAKEGVAVSETLANNMAGKLKELKNVPGFAETFLNKGKPRKSGERLILAKLADTLDHLAKAGLNDFYRGDLARSLATDLETVGSPLRLSDLERHQALLLEPLSADIAGHRVFNMPPPTQGLASLMVLATFARLKTPQADDFTFIHNLVESTKAAFRVRDAKVTDPAFMDPAPEFYLSDEHITELSKGIKPKRAADWPDATPGGDTVWLGAIDRDGNAVSFIQSVYWEFGSGVVLNKSGVNWQNRGTSFSLDPDHHNHLKPFRRPFHTIQPAMALLKDGRHMVYGTMGGEGQPQTQAVIFARYAMFNQDLQDTISAPRWLLGRTWGETSAKLRIECRFDPKVIRALKRAGHDLLEVGAFEEVMGHAGAIVRHPDGLLAGASDPRSDGAVAAL